jgi:hypothetical protein
MMVGKEAATRAAPVVEMNSQRLNREAGSFIVQRQFMVCCGESNGARRACHSQFCNGCF